MDERHVRYPAGPNGDGTTHRVGLTRHCLASGLVQLPFALRDTLPEGDLLALDAERDESVHLISVPPRQLGGLSEFFRAHDLQVNDQLEIRVSSGETREVRIGPLRRARTPTPPRDQSDSAEQGAAPTQAQRQVSTWYSVRDDPAPPRTRHVPHAIDVDAADAMDLEAIEGDTTLEQLADRVDLPAVTKEETERPDLVERIGSVTVRRLGIDPNSGAQALRLATPADDVELSTPTPASDDVAPDPPLLGVDPERRLEGLASLASTDPVDLAIEPELAIEVNEQITERPRHAHRANSADDVRQLPLFGAPDEASPSTRRPERTVEPLRKAPPPRATAGRPPLTRRPGAPQRRRVEGGPAQKVPAAAATPVTATPVTATPTTAEQATVGNDRKRSDREEELSRAGDLRSRIIRWLLEPSTPVIVPLERVQDAFELPADVAREIVDGVLESPPPSLRLTRVRDDLLRVSRITVEQNA